MHGHEHAKTGVTAGQFFDDNALADGIQTGAAIGFIDRHSRETELGELIPLFAGEGLILVALQSARHELVFSKLAHGLAYHVLFVSVLEMHGSLRGWIT